MKRNNWTREELLVAFNLYCKIPFSRINYKQPEIINLASKIGRTPSAVAWKLVNFASFDPSLQKRGVKGASNSSKLDKEIFYQFYENWDEMLFESERLLAEKEKQTIEEVYAPILNNIISEKHGEYKIREVKIDIAR